MVAAVRVDVGQPKLFRALPLILFVLAVLIRIPGLGWGLKNDLHNGSYHPDEPVIFGFSRGVVPGLGKLIPGRYNYGTLYLTLLRIGSDITTTYTGGPKVKGDGWAPWQPDGTDWDWASRCDIAGRIISLFAGAGTVLAVFFIGRMCFGDAAGGLAGLVMAIAPGFVMHSRFQTVDALATFLLACSFYYAVKIVTHPSASVQKLSVWCGVFAGLSAGTKYTGIFAIFALAAALWIAKPKGGISAFISGCLSSAMAFVVATPGAIFDSQRFIDDFTFEMHHTATGHGLVFAGTPNGFIYNFINLSLGIDLLLAVLGVAGLFYAAYRRHSWAAVLLAFWIPYYVLIGRAEVKFLRYTFPLYVGVAVGVGYAMVVAYQRRGWARVGVGIGALGFAGVGGGGIASTVQTSLNMMGTDPRDATAEYLRSVGGRVGFVNNPWFWSPPLYPDSAVSMIPPKYRIEQMREEANPPVDVTVGGDGNVPPWDTKLITDLHPDRITFSSFEYFPVERLRPTQPSRFMDLLEKEYTVEKVIGCKHRGLISENMMPEDLLYAEPTMWVWKRK